MVQRSLLRHSSWLLCFAFGCASEESTTTTATGNSVTKDACVFPLVTLRTGHSSSCGGVNTHSWPIGMAATACHGWSSVDTNGKSHENSANTIQCNPDGSFSFLQYAGNLTCSGTGVLKSYTAGKCEQDTPPVLYTEATDLTCCSDPTAAACKSGVPSVTVDGSTIYLNGDVCGG